MFSCGGANCTLSGMYSSKWESVLNLECSVICKFSVDTGTCWDNKFDQLCSYFKIFNFNSSYYQLEIWKLWSMISSDHPVPKKEDWSMISDHSPESSCWLESRTKATGVLRASGSGQYENWQEFPSQNTFTQKYSCCCFRAFSYGMSNLSSHCALLVSWFERQK